MRRPAPSSIVALLLAAVAASPARAGELAVVSASPAPRSLGASPAASIAVTFDAAVDPATVDGGSFTAFGRWSGAVTGGYSFSGDGRTVTLTPVAPLSAGEAVMVLLSHDLAGLDGSPLRAAGYSFQFWTAADAASFDVVEADRMTTRSSPGDPSRAYGGFAADLDEDGRLDLTIVNEVTSDLRVFLARTDGSGLFEAFLEPTTPTGNVPSPSETADFDGDGLTDVAVANTQGGSVSILLGNGDGTFGRHQQIVIGGNPRGIAVLDADGDGDPDVAATRTNGSDLAVLANDGDGVFGVPTFFGAGNGTPWALAAADFDEDGVLDLAVGTQGGQRARIYRGLGDGGFTLISDQPIGGGAWMAVAGDVNGDGHEDLAVANGFSDSGAILLGDGAGNLASPVLYAVDPLAIASDLGDLDGDGDLDWITASFNGDWRLFANDGRGGFSSVTEFPATDAASCSLMFDMDGDGDLDLALIDEIADEVIVLHNRGGLFSDGWESGDPSRWSQTVD